MTKLTEKTAETLAPVSNKPQSYFDIEGKSLSELADMAEDCFMDLTNPSNLNTVLQIRSQLVDRMKPLNTLIETIESEVKDANLEGGKYGFMATLTVSYAKKTTYDEKKIFEKIADKGLNPLEYAKLNTSDEFVKALVKNNPGLCTVDPHGTKKHLFK